MDRIRREIIESRNMAQARIAELERDQSDITHEIERKRCRYADRARLATKLQAVLAERRVLKDWLHKTKRIASVIESNSGVNAQKWTNELLGVAREAAKQAALHDSA
ncbi:MAG: hypothetical protein FWE08_03730 [Oscillospiraceae bacterium]|nr:hypothetical protein [Oscillospiraceae bacterium]